jgi:hypothetical protein
MNELDNETLCQILKLVYADFKEIQDNLKGIKNINLIESVKKIVEESIRR